MAHTHPTKRAEADLLVKSRYPSLDKHSLSVQIIMVLLMSCLLSGVAARPVFADTPESKRYQTTISYTPLSYGPMLVQVRLSSSLTGTFLLDTGFSIACVTDALAAKMGLSPLPAVGTSGKPITFYPGKQSQRVTVPLMQLGNFRLFDSFCLVLNQKALSDIAGQPVDGVLDAGMLAIYPMCFDFARHEITMFSPSPLTSAELRSIGMEDAARIPVTRMTGGGVSFSCPAAMSNGSERVQESLLIDTGAVGTVLSEDTAQKLRLKPVSGNRNSPTLLGNIVVKQAYLADLSLGNLSVKNLLLRYSSGLSDSFPAHIGLDVLSQFRVLLDFKQQIMYLKPIAPAIPTTSAEDTPKIKKP